MPDPRSARLFVLAGPDLARSFPLGERTTLGRSDECDVVLHDRSISRKHAVLVCAGQSWFVQDLGSTNGVSKDGRRAERIELADGDEFLLGELPLRLRLLDGAAEHEVEFAFAPAAELRPAPRAPAPTRHELELEVEIEGDVKGDIELEVDGEVELGDDAEDDADELEIEIGGPDAESAHRPALAGTNFVAARAARHSGFFAGDLAQRPVWLRAVLVLVLLVVCAGLVYGAFWAVQTLRSGL